MCPTRALDHPPVEGFVVERGGDMDRDALREAFMHATSGNWRQHVAYIDRILDEAAEAQLVDA
jgi:hypothetical protein